MPLLLFSYFTFPQSVLFVSVFRLTLDFCSVLMFPIFRLVRDSVVGHIALSFLLFVYSFPLQLAHLPLPLRRVGYCFGTP